MAGEANPIRHVSDTALWVAVYRAMESERHDALFHDPYARRLGGERGQRVVDTLPGGKATAWPIIVRTVVMDEIIARCIAGGATTVLNLAAGLDTRPFRMALPPTLRWLHVDLPDMVDYVRGTLAGETPNCQLEFLAADLRDATARRNVFARAARSPDERVLVITEGLLIYLESADVEALARDLRAQPQFRWWLTDMATPALLRMLARRRQLVMQAAPFRFAPADPPAFFARLGWRETEFRSSWAESLRLGRSVPFARFWQWLSRLQSPERRAQGLRMSGIELFEPAAHPAVGDAP